MSLMSMFPGGGGTNNQPLKAPTNLTVQMNTPTSVQIRWTDPENEYSQPSGQLIGEWMFTRIVRKIGSAPVNANDGELVVDSAVKNQYQTTPFVDSEGIVTGAHYYYAAFAYTVSRVQSPGAYADIVATYYDPVLNNNTWTMIYQAYTEGVAGDIWSIGDTKTDSSGITFSLRMIDPEIYPYSDGSGYPAMIFVVNHALSQTWFANRYQQGDYAMWYGDAACNLRTVIEGYDETLGEELASFIKPVNFSLWGLPEKPGQRQYSARSFPIGVNYVQTVFPTQASRKLANNGWWLGDVTARDGSIYAGYDYYSAIADSSGAVDDPGETTGDLFPVHNYHVARQSAEGYGAVFGIGFGKQVAH